MIGAFTPPHPALPSKHAACQKSSTIAARSLPRRPPFTAFEQVNLAIFSGRTLALVGESGSGKSVLARCLVRLEEPTSGELEIEGQDFLALSGNVLRHARRKAQLIFRRRCRP